MNDSSNAKKNWNSLEIVKLLVPIIATLVVTYFGVNINRQMETFKATIQQNNKMIDSVLQKRIALYDQIGGRLNRLFTYYMFIGKWKEQSPSDVINNKRDLDELIFTYQPFLSKDFVSKYFQLESELFKSYNGWGMDAKLRTVITNRPQFYLPKDRSNAWDPVWDASFTGEDNTEAIRKAYSDLVSALPRELGIPDLWEGRARPISINDVAKSHAPPKNSTKSD